jgi:hypothetical protein
MCPAGPAAVCFRASEQPTQVNPLADDRADHIRSGLGDPATVGHDHLWDMITRSVRAAP